MLKLETNHFLQELKEENNNLIKDLNIILKLLESYRSCLLRFTKSCKCLQNEENITKLDKLEEYFTKINERISLKSNDLMKDELKVDQNDNTFENRVLSKQTICVLNSNGDSNDVMDTKETINEVIGGQQSKPSPKKRKLINRTKLKSFQESKHIFCPEVGCGKQFKCLQNLRKHTKTVHLNLRPFPCDWPGCESAFKTREAMTNHKSVHSSERNFKCDFEGCNKSFKIRCKLTQHMRCHGIGPKNERFPCSWPACGQFCASEQALTEHLNRHQNIRPFICQFEGCGKSYFTSFELRQHSMKFHEQNESFRCDYKDCSMSFLNKRDLAKHRRLHIDVAKFICSWPECSHTFNTSRDLSDHMNRHMDIKANKCHFIGCDRRYFTKKDLSRHIKQSHS